MYHHVVMFNFVEGTDVDEMARLLWGLGYIKDVIRIDVRQTDDEHDVFGAADLVLHVVLPDKDAYERYDTDPYHVGTVKPALDAALPPLTYVPPPGRYAVDYTLHAEG